MAWVIGKGSRQQEQHGTGGLFYTDFIFTVIGTTGTEDIAANKPALGEELTEVIGGAETLRDLTNTMDAEPTVVSVGQISYLTANRCSAKIRLRGFLTE